MKYEQIIYEVKEHILTLTLNRPDHLNAFTPQMRNELLDAFDRADADDQIRAIIVTGAGRALCAGMDLSSGGDTFDYKIKDGQPRIEDHRDGGGKLTLRIFKSLKPVIAAINGPAVGIGITMTLPMDIRIAASNAKLGFVFTRRGIVPEACSSWFLPPHRRRQPGPGVGVVRTYTYRRRSCPGRAGKKYSPSRSTAGGGQRPGSGNRSQHFSCIRRPGASDAVADARGGSPDGGP